MSASGPSGPLVLSYCPLQIWALKTCNQDILKIIIASSFKQKMISRLSGEHCLFFFYFFELLPFAYLGIESQNLL